MEVIDALRDVWKDHRGRDADADVEKLFEVLADYADSGLGIPADRLQQLAFLMADVADMLAKADDEEGGDPNPSDFLDEEDKHAG
jgi:hypothetical protein